MHASTSPEKQAEHIAALQTEINALQMTLGVNEDSEKIVSKHIKLLHQYNESKDATQILIGRLATLKQTTVKQIHIDLQLTGDD